MADGQRRLLYCTKHTITDAEGAPCHEHAVFHDVLVQRWQHYCARKYPSLDSSQLLLHQVVLCLP